MEGVPASVPPLLLVLPLLLLVLPLLLLVLPLLLLVLPLLLLVLPLLLLVELPLLLVLEVVPPLPLPEPGGVAVPDEHAKPEHIPAASNESSETL
jgi:hypothetical protein